MHKIEIVDNLTALEAFIGASSGRIDSVTYKTIPKTNIRIKNATNLGLYSEELFGLIDIKKAIDDQIFLIRQILDGRNIHQNNEIYYAIENGSIDIQAVFDIFKKLIEDPGLSKRGMVLVLGLSVIWASTNWYSAWAEISKVGRQEKTKIEIKKMEMQNEELKRKHELELKAIEIITRDEELKKLAKRTYNSFAKIYHNVRSDSDVIINSLPLSDEEISFFIRTNSLNDDWADRIEGRFTAKKLKKKGKELYQIELLNIDTHKLYRVKLNMELYDNSLQKIIHEWYRKGSTLYVHLQFFRKDGHLIRTELAQIGDNKLRHFAKRKLTSKYSGRKKRRR